MNQKLKGSRNFLITYGGIMSGISLLTLLSNIPALIFGEPLILSLVLMPALLPMSLAYFIFGLRIEKI